VDGGGQVGWRLALFKLASPRGGDASFRCKRLSTNALSGGNRVPGQPWYTEVVYRGGPLSMKPYYIKCHRNPVH